MNLNDLPEAANNAANRLFVQLCQILQPAIDSPDTMDPYDILIDIQDALPGFGGHMPRSDSPAINAFFCGPIDQLQRMSDEDWENLGEQGEHDLVMALAQGATKALNDIAQRAAKFGPGFRTRQEAVDALEQAHAALTAAPDASSIERPRS